MAFCLGRVVQLRALHCRFKQRGFSNTTPGNDENEDAFGEKMEPLKLLLGFYAVYVLCRAVEGDLCGLRVQADQETPSKVA